MRTDKLSQPPRVRYAWLAWAGWTALIVALTTVPFGGHPRRGAGAITWIPFTGPVPLRDVVANILLFVPFGTAFAMARRRPFGRVLGEVAALAFLLSSGVELIQVMWQTRFSSMTDVVTNLTGAIAGALLVDAPQGRLGRDESGQDVATRPGRGKL